MKKLLCITLILILCLSAVSAALADTTPFGPTLTSVFDTAIEDWFEDTAYCALLTMTLTLDYMSAGGEDDSYNAYDSAVGKSGDDYCVLIPGAATTLAVFFTHGKDTADYQILPVTDPEEAKAGLVYDFMDNQATDIDAAVQYLLELLSGTEE